MKIRQEVWTPYTHWKTALNHGDLRQPGVVFCFGNPGNHNSQAIYNEVRHSFPGADLVFGFLDNTNEEKLFLTAINCPESTFKIDKISLDNISDDVAVLTDHCIERKWKQALISLDADKNYSRQLINQLETALSPTFNTISSRLPDQRIQLGLNEMPSYHSSICLTMNGTVMQFSDNRKKKSSGKGSTAAAQSIWDRYATNLTTQNEHYILHFPFAFISQ